MRLSLLRNVAAAALLGGATLLPAMSAAWAAETVAVELVGERGGEMAVNLDKSEVPAGEVTFKVVNAARDTPHEMIMVRVDDAGKELVVDPATEKVDESALNDLGEVDGLKAGESGELAVTLEPGSYKLICNLKGHVMAGMVADFTVSAS